MTRKEKMDKLRKIRLEKTGSSEPYWKQRRRKSRTP